MPLGYSPLPVRRRERIAGGMGRGKRLWSGFLNRVGSIAGLVVVVHFAMNAEIASRETKRRAPMTTLASSPFRIRS